MNNVKQAGVGVWGGTSQALPHKILLNLGQQSGAHPEFLIRWKGGGWLIMRLHTIYV